MVWTGFSCPGLLRDGGGGSKGKNGRTLDLKNTEGFTARNTTEKTKYPAGKLESGSRAGNGELIKDELN